MIVPESYQNREQTYVKHQLLKTYLERLFMIIGQHQSVIRYVDCFSGPWNERDEGLQDTSIGISLDIMHKCQDALTKMGKSISFQALFIEKDRRSFERLKAHLDTSASNGVTTLAFNGEFYELRGKILDWCGQNDFTFFFIDPKGWKRVVELSTLEPFLKRPNSEFLINFMYDFLVRTHTQEPFQEDMCEIFGNVPDTSAMEPKQKEACLINLYRTRLKHIAPLGGGVPRTAVVPILYPTKERTLYHLVYLTRHPKGIVVFMERSEKLWLVQRRVREQAKHEQRVSRTRQCEFEFQFEDNCECMKNVDISEVRSYWLSKLSNYPRQFGIEQLSDMIEETGWFESDFQIAFRELSREGIVANTDQTNRRRTKFVNFEADHNKGENLIRLKS